MRKTLFALAMCCMALVAGQGSKAAEAGGRMLPSLQLFQPGGEPLAESALPQDVSWAVAVVNAGLQSSHAFMTALTSKHDNFGDRLLIVVIGNQQELEAYRAQYESLSGVRWLQADNTVVDALALPGTPAVLGIASDKSVAWQFSGMPVSPEHLPARIRAWIGVAAESQLPGPTK